MNAVHIWDHSWYHVITMCSQKQYRCSYCYMGSYHACKSIFLWHASLIILKPCSIELWWSIRCPFAGLLYGYTDLVCYLCYNCRRHIRCISSFGRGLSIVCVCVSRSPCSLETFAFSSFVHSLFCHILFIILQIESY
jgi:hypothetical protein